MEAGLGGGGSLRVERGDHSPVEVGTGVGVQVGVATGVGRGAGVGATLGSGVLKSESDRSRSRRSGGTHRDLGLTLERGATS